MTTPESWTLAVLPDTQGYAQAYPQVFLSQTDWIARNQRIYNIQAVVHLGDITEDNLPSEWELARKAMDALRRSGIQYVLSLGNHDLAPRSRETLFNQYFSEADSPHDCGCFEDGKLENSWHKLSPATGHRIVLALEFAPRPEVLEWANGVVAAHREHEIIVVTHAYLYWDGTRFDWDKYGEAQEYSPTRYIPPEHGQGCDGEVIWQRLISRHPNIAMVLSGHVLGGGAAHLTSQSEHRQSVHQLVTNFQPGVIPDRGYGGGGFLRLLRFSTDGPMVDVKTYSPWLDQWLETPDHCFQLSLY